MILTLPCYLLSRHGVIAYSLYSIDKSYAGSLVSALIGGLLTFLSCSIELPCTQNCLTLITAHYRIIFHDTLQVCLEGTGEELSLPSWPLDQKLAPAMAVLSNVRTKMKLTGIERQQHCVYVFSDCYPSFPCSYSGVSPEGVWQASGGS